MKDLAERVARLFSPKPWKHDIGATHKSQHKEHCIKCDKWLVENTKTHCPIPDPIDITDLGKALECFRGLWISNGITDGDDFQYSKANDIFKQVKPEYYGEMLASDEVYEVYIMWLALEATAEEINEICCLAKESSNE